jgi:UDP-2,4-diacetamido-2,4,6-trideoxy-beta-L-altropyranose hydrolase
MQFIIRADASFSIGSGHVMRCLTLADSLIEKGHQVSFICNHSPGDLINYLKENNYSCHPINIKKNTWQEDAKACGHILSSNHKKIDWVIVDSYDLDERWHKRIRAHASKILVIDDTVVNKFDADLILNQNELCDYKKYYSLCSKAKLLLGNRYTLIKKHIINETKQYSVKDNITQIYLNFGGYDQKKVSILCLKALSNLKNASSLNIILHYAKDDALKKISASYEKAFNRITFLGFKNDITQELKCSDLAIGAGGSSLLERFCIGIPNIVISTANNQIEICQHLNKLKRIFYLGEADTLNPDLILTKIQPYLNNPNKRIELSKNAKESIDGRGCERIVNILCTEIKLIAATLNHSKLIYTWRNHPQNRSMSLSNNIISANEHDIWFQKSLQNAKRHIFVAQNINTKKNQGVCRLDIEHDYAIVSIYLKPNITGAGFGTIILEALISWAKINLTVQELIAEIKPENIKSIKMFLNLGFQWSEKQIYRLILN